MTTDIKCFYPNELDNLFVELWNLTEEIKIYYAYHTVLLIIESVLLFVSSLTKLTFIYTSNLDEALLNNKLYLIYCILKMIFLFFIVQEAHNTIQEVSNTLFINFYSIKLLLFMFIRKIGL